MQPAVSDDMNIHVAAAPEQIFCTCLNCCMSVYIFPTPIESALNTVIFSPLFYFYHKISGDHGHQCSAYGVNNNSCFTCRKHLVGREIKQTAKKIINGMMFLVIRAISAASHPNKTAFTTESAIMTGLLSTNAPEHIRADMYSSNKKSSGRRDLLPGIFSGQTFPPSSRRPIHRFGLLLTQQYRLPYLAYFMRPPHLAFGIRGSIGFRFV